MKTNIILQGDSLEQLKTLPDESIDCVMTSPPYWALRDYGSVGMIWDEDKDCEHDWNEYKTSPRGGHSHPDRPPKVGANRSEMEEGSSIRFGSISNFCSKCSAWKGQLGLEPIFDLYIKHLCDIFDEVKRVLKKTGTCWVNLGDTYYGSGKGAGGDITDSKQVWGFENKTTKNCDHCGKEFEGYAFQKFCGSACSGVDNTPRERKGELKDKCLTLIPMRFAIEMVNRGWILRNNIIWHKRNIMPSSAKDRFTVDFENLFFFTKNKKYYFETQYEPHLTSNNQPEFQNKKWKGKGNNIRVHHGGEKNPDYLNPQGRNKRTVWSINPKPYKEAHFAVYPEKLCETPIKAGCPKEGIVLDPFFGSGTTGIVALKQQKKFIGIELNSEYIEIANKRLKPYLEQKIL